MDKEVIIHRVPAITFVPVMYPFLPEHPKTSQPELMHYANVMMGELQAYVKYFRKESAFFYDYFNVHRDPIDFTHVSVRLAQVTPMVVPNLCDVINGTAVRRKTVLFRFNVEIIWELVSNDSKRIKDHFCANNKALLDFRRILETSLLWCGANYSYRHLGISPHQNCSLGLIMGVIVLLGGINKVNWTPSDRAATLPTKVDIGIDSGTGAEITYPFPGYKSYTTRTFLASEGAREY